MVIILVLSLIVVGILIYLSFYGDHPDELDEHGNSKRGRKR